MMMMMMMTTMRGLCQTSTTQRVPSIFILLTSLAMSSLVQSSDSSKPNKLLLILIDGFRWDYFDMFSEDELPGFNRLRQSGVSADALIPAFPSLSYVNYYSIMTGNLQFWFNLSSIGCVISVTHNNTIINFDILVGPTRGPKLARYHSLP